MNKAVKDALVFALVGSVGYALALYFDLHKALHDTFSFGDEFVVDEAILALQVVGICGFIYGLRRIFDLRAEIGLRTTAEGRAEFLAFHDILTGLANRHFVEERLPTLDRVLQFHSVFAIDLHDFKRVNDLAGHKGGDLLLKIMAQRLRSAFPDEIVARTGGDEFLVVAATDHAKEADVLAQKIVALLLRPAEINDVAVEVGICVGSAAITSPDQIKAAIAHADLAMGEAKRRGRNQHCAYTPELGQELAGRLELESMLREAIAADRIDVHFQPLVRLSDRSVYGFEALARWTRPDGARVPPDIFVAIAERAGLISDLSTGLLRKACIQALSWPPHLKLSFNVSPLQLTDVWLTERILTVLRETGLPPKRVSIEITETAVVVELDRAVTALERLRAAGVRIALDDFGTGYSSLAQLANIPFDKIKIDRRFIQTFLDNDKQMKIVRSIVNLGQGLGVATLAEGVETEEQYLQLRQLGCELGQGYLFARPMPASEVTAYLACASPDRQTA